MKVGGRYDNIKEEGSDIMELQTFKKSHLKRNIIIMGIIILINL